MNTIATTVFRIKNQETAWDTQSAASVAIQVRAERKGYVFWLEVSIQPLEWIL